MTNTSVAQTSLIPLWNVTVGQEVLTTVNARELHAFLENGDHFSTWIKDRISYYEFIQDVDFTITPKAMKNPKGRPLSDYYLTLDTAKMIAAAERNAKGKAALLYFIKNPSVSPEQLLAYIQDIDLPDADEMFVYAIREVDTGRIKLGISKNPVARLKQLQTANASRLEIAALREAPNRFSDERAIHADAEAYHLHGEWFSASALEVLQ